MTNDDTKHDPSALPLSAEEIGHIAACLRDGYHPAAPKLAERFLSAMHAERTLREQTQQRLEKMVAAFNESDALASSLSLQLEQTQQQLAEEFRLHRATEDKLDDLEEEIIRLRAARPSPEPTLREALEKFGRHVHPCASEDWTHPGWGMSTGKRCDCGLEAALASVSPPPPEGREP